MNGFISIWRKHKFTSGECVVSVCNEWSWSRQRKHQTCNSNDDLQQSSRHLSRSIFVCLFSTIWNWKRCYVMIFGELFLFCVIFCIKKLAGNLRIICEIHFENEYNVLIRKNMTEKYLIYFICIQIVFSLLNIGSKPYCSFVICYQKERKKYHL